MGSLAKERIHELLHILDQDDAADADALPETQQEATKPADDARSLASDAVTDLSDITTTDATDHSDPDDVPRARRGRGPAPALQPRVQQLESKVLQLSRERTQLQLKYDHDIKQKNREILQLRKQLDHDLKAIERRQHEVEAKAPLLTQQLHQAKAALASVQISDEVFRELQQRPADSLSLADQVKLVVHESLRDLKADNERLRLALEASREAGARLETERARLQREAARLAAELSQRDADIEATVGGLQARIERLAHELEASLTQVEVLSAKGQMFDQLQSNYDKLEEVAVRLRAVEQAGRHIERHAGELEAQLKERDHTLQLLMMDKAYLSKQGEALQEQVQRLERELEAKGNRVSELKKARQELWDRLVAEGSSAREQQRAALQAEVSRIQALAQADIDRIRKENTEAYERESRLLRDLRDEAQAEAARCQTTLAALQKEHTALGKTHLEVVARLETRAAELEARAKAAELAQQTTEQLCAEREAALKKAQTQVDMLQAKVGVLTDSYYTLEAERARTVAELTAQVEQQAAALGQYCALEGSLDDAILRAAGLPDGVGDAGSEQQLGKALDTAGLATIRTRLRQGLALAARCAHLEAERGTIQKELEQARGRATRLEAELAKAKLFSQSASRPHAAVLEDLQAAQQRAEEATQQLKDVQALLEAKERARQQLAEENGALRADLGRILAERANLQAVKAMVAAALEPLGLAPRPATAAT